MKELTLSFLKNEAAIFVKDLSITPISDLYGITDGKAVGTYVEQAFNKYLQKKYLYTPGSAASGIDFPELYYVRLNSYNLKFVVGLQP